MTDKYRHTKTERNALLHDLERLRRPEDEREFMQLLRKHGIRDEDPRFAELVELFRQLRSGKT